MLKLFKTYLPSLLAGPAVYLTLSFDTLSPVILGMFVLAFGFLYGRQRRMLTKSKGKSLSFFRAYFSLDLLFAIMISLQAVWVINTLQPFIGPEVLAIFANAALATLAFNTLMASFVATTVRDTTTTLDLGLSLSVGGLIIFSLTPGIWTIPGLRFSMLALVAMSLSVAVSFGFVAHSLIKEHVLTH